MNKPLTTTFIPQALMKKAGKANEDFHDDENPNWDGIVRKEEKVVGCLVYSWESDDDIPTHEEVVKQALECEANHIYIGDFEGESLTLVILTV